MPATVTGQSKPTDVTVTGNTKGELLDEFDDFLLKEDGGFLLKEDGGKFVLEPDDIGLSTKPGNATVTGITKP